MADWQRKRLVRALGLAVALGSGTATAGARYEHKQGEVVAFEGDQERWRFATGARKEGEAVEPLVVGEVVVFCAEGQVYEAAAEDGVIRRRLSLPGRCAGLKGRGAGYEVRCQGRSSRPWERSYAVSFGEAPGWAPLPAELALMMGPRRQLDELLRGEKDRARSVALLDQRRKQDPTNPWYDLRKIELLHEAGEAAGVKQAIDELLRRDATNDVDLLTIAPRLGEVDRAAGDRAFERGMRQLLERGYEPEMSSSMLTMAVLLGKPPRPDAPEALERRAEQILDLSPGAEGSTSFFAALARSAEQRGDAEAARRFKPLGERSVGQNFFAFPAPESRDAGACLQLAMAMILAIVSGAVVKSIRGASLRVEGPRWQRWNPLARWDRGELVGLLLALAALTAVSHRTARGVAAIGAAAAAPLSLVSGVVGHPESRAYLAEKQGPAGLRFAALSAHKAGDLDEAERLYRQAPSAASLANLGAIAAQRGDHAGAQRLWHEALARQPDLDAALHNLGRPAPGPRAERARRYRLSSPLLAIPAEGDWAALWRERSAPAGLTGVAALTSLHEVLASQSLDGTPGFNAASVILPAELLLLALALLALAPRALSPGSNRPALLASALAAVAPGAGRFLGAAWPFFGAAVLYLAMSAHWLGATQGLATNALDGLGTADFARQYGASLAPQVAPWLRSLASGWWALLLLNLALVVALDLRAARRAPGP